MSLHWILVPSASPQPLSQKKIPPQLKKDKRHLQSHFQISLKGIRSKHGVEVSLMQVFAFSNILLPAVIMFLFDSWSLTSESTY